MFFMSNEFGIMAKIGLGCDLWWFWGFDFFFLSITHVSERNCLISLR